MDGREHRFRSYACACSPSLGRLMERAQQCTTLFLNAMFHNGNQACSVQLNHMLMLCKATASTRSVNAGAQEGLAWRLLVLHEPTLTRSAGLSQELLNVSFDEWSTRPVRLRCRLREGESREVSQQHSRGSVTEHDAGWSLETAFWC